MSVFFNVLSYFQPLESGRVTEQSGINMVFCREVPRSGPFPRCDRMSYKGGKAQTWPFPLPPVCPLSEREINRKSCKTAATFTKCNNVLQRWSTSESLCPVWICSSGIYKPYSDKVAFYLKEKKKHWRDISDTDYLLSYPATLPIMPLYLSPSSQSPLSSFVSANICVYNRL